MTEQKAIIGICMVCALAISAFAAQGASAASSTTAVTCVSGGPTFDFADEDCRTPLPTRPGDYGHVPITEPTNTQGSGGETRIRATISGINVELVSTSLTATGTMENSLVGGEHRASGTGTITYNGATVAAPAGKGCSIAGGKIVTNKLAGTTAGQGMGIKISPAEGETLAEFEVTGCGPTEALKALNGVYKVTGSVVGTPEGAVNTFTHAGTTTQGTLKLRGQKAGIAGECTEESTSGNQIATTTFT